MNKIYKLVWSKARNMYVAVAEIAKSHTKSPKTGILNQSLVAGVLACVIGCGMYMPSVMAANTANMNSSGEDGNMTYIVDDNTQLGIGKNSVAIGVGATLKNPGSNSVSIGEYTYTVDGSIAIGGRYDAQAWNIDGQGDRIFGTSAEAGNSIVLGAASHSTKAGTIIMGNNIILNNANAIAIGLGTSVTADNAVALGVNSAATETNTVSFGNNTLKRRLVNIAPGTKANDAVVLSQLNDRTKFIGINSSGASDVNYEGGGATGSNSIAIGKSATATLGSSISIGTSATNEASSSVVIGANTSAKPTEGGSSNSNVVVGAAAGVVGNNGTALGSAAYVEGTNATAVGQHVRALANGATAVGSGVEAASGDGATNTGATYAAGTNSSAYGHQARAELANSIALGAFSHAEGTGTIALGNSSDAISTDSVAIGRGAKTNPVGTAGSNIAIGANSSTNGGIAIGAASRTGSADTQAAYSIAMGFDTVSEKGNSTTLGSRSSSSGAYDTVVGYGSKALSDSDTVVGYNSFVNGASSIAIGNSSEIGTAETAFANSIAMGVKSSVQGSTDIAIGNNATVTGNQSVAIGYNAKAENGDGVALGHSAKALANNSMALGMLSNASANNSVAIGDVARSSGARSVALGTSSIATESNVVSVGHKVGDISYNDTAYDSDLFRRIINVADGIDAHDAVAMEQLNQEISEREVADDLLDSRIGTQPEDGNYIASSATNSVAQNVNILDTELKNLSDSVSDELDTKADVNLTNITEAGETVVKNLAKGSVNVVGTDKATVSKAIVNDVDVYTVSVKANGEVTENNENIVSGGTVYTALQEQKGEIDTALTGKANIGLDNITDDGKTVVRDLAKESVKVIAGSYTNITEGTDGNAKTYAVNVRVNGQVAENNNDIVTGNTVYQALTQQQTALETALEGKANIELDNISDEGHAVIKTDAKSAINVVGGEYATVTKTNQSGVDTYTVDVATDGAVAENSDKLVTGDTVYRALQDQQSATSTALAGKANVDASNVTDAVAWGEKIATGTVMETEERAVSGKTVFAELRPEDGNYVKKTKATAENLVALDTQVKTNADAIATNTSDITNLKDLSNITEAGETVIKNLSKGSVNVIGTDKATVTKSDQDGVDTYTVSVKADGEVTEGNENIVSGGTVYTALQSQQTATSTALNGKANVDASNVTNANAWGQKIATGTIADGDVRAVSGDTVHTVLQEQQNTMNVALEGKANTNLDNITDAGHDVIKADAKSVVNVVGGSYATVDKTDVNGVDTYTVNVDTNGEVSEGNDKLVTGGTVYQALVNQQTDINTALEGKANVDASNVTDATAWAEKIGTGVVSPENTQLVTGKKVAEETRVAEDGAYVSKDNTAGQNISALDVQVKANTDALTTLGSDKADKDLDNITDTGKDVIRDLAKGSVKVINGTHTTVTEGVSGDAKTYAVNVETDGTITENDEGIVTGGTVYRAIETAKDTVSSDVDTKLEGYAKIDGSNVTTPTTWGAKLGTGKVLEGNGELVTGDTVYQTVKTLAEVTADALDVKANSDASNVGKNADTDNSTAWGEALGTGTVSSNDTRLVTGETVYNEVRPATDGEYVKTTNTTAENLQVLDTQIAELTSQAQDFVAYDGTDHSKVTLGGTNGTTISNVADGELSETSTDAVTGKQLYATNSEISAIKDTLSDNDGKIRELRTDVNTLQTDVTDLRTEYDTTKEQVATGFDVQTDGTKVKTVNPDSNVINFKSGNHVALSNDNGSVKIDVVDDGQVAEGNTGLVTGGTVYQAIEDMNIPGALDTKANTDLDNISDAGKDVVRNLAKGSVNVVGKDEIKVAKTTENDVDTYTVSIEPNGQVAEGNTGLVTGGTVYNTIQQLGEEYARKDASNVDTQVWGEKLGAGTVDSSNNKLVSGKTVAEETRVATDGNYVQQTNTAGQNLSELDRVLKETRDIAEAAALTGTDADAVHYDGADKDTITLAGENGTVITNLKDGELSANSKDAVTGKQLFETNEKVAENTEKITALTDKVGTVSDGNYVNGNQTIGESIGALDTQLKTVSDGLDTVRNDVDTLRDTMTEGLDGKSNTDLSNITEEGKTVISDIAKASVKVKGSGLATVTSAEEGQAMVYTVDVQANGVVEEGNTGLVNGGTVYNSIQEVRNDFATNLTDKADTDLGNLTDVGKDVIRETMQSDLDKKADKVDLDTKANVDASNIDTKAWQEVLGDGVIEEGNTGLINGGTAFRAIQEIKDNEVVKADFENGVIRLANEARYDGIDVIDVSKSDGSSRVMTGVATNPNDPTSVANVGYVNAVGQVVLDNVNNRFEQVDNRMSKVGASAAAMASLPMPPMDDDEKWAFSAAVGHYDSKTAGAVGAFYRPQDNVIVNVRGAVGNGEDMVGAGVGIALQRGNTPSVSKAQLVKTINAQADKIQEQDARIAELEAVVAELVAKK